MGDDKECIPLVSLSDAIKKARGEDVPIKFRGFA
jgi:hypothetical protein